MSERFGAELAQLQDSFMRLSKADPREAIALVLRFTVAPPASVRSRRALSRVRLQSN
jgi:hypothetical protein